jgi:hypothetical protein
MAKWAIQVNVAGIAPWEPGQFPQVPEGPYAGIIRAADEKQGSTDPTKTNVWFTAEITEPGEGQGLTPNVIIGKDTTKEGNRKKWRALLLSIGANPAALENRDGLNLTDDMFVGKPCFIYVSEPPEGTTRTDGKPGKPFNDVVFVAPEFYQKKKAERASGVGAATSTGSMLPAGGGAGPQPGANGANLNALAAGLGGSAPSGGPPLFGGK